MATVVLVRHGRSTANSSGVLAGRSEGVELAEAGLEQVGALGRRLADVRLRAVVSSPLSRCVRTAEAILACQPVIADDADGADGGPAAPANPGLASSSITLDDHLIECGYGDWTGRKIVDLATEPLWQVVQAHPAGAVFPGPEGEAMAAMATRAVAAIRNRDAAIEAQHGPGAVWAAVSHGDVIKAIVADALGLHLDLFQRIVIDPGSVTVIRYTPLRPFLVRLNDGETTLDAILADPGPHRSMASSDAVVGGGAGPAEAPEDPAT